MTEQGAAYVQHTTASQQFGKLLRNLEFCPLTSHNSQRRFATEEEVQLALGPTCSTVDLCMDSPETAELWNTATDPELPSGQSGVFTAPAGPDSLRLHFLQESKQPPGAGAFYIDAIKVVALLQ